MNMEDFETFEVNKVWTKYLTETRKVWDGQKDFRKQKGLRNVEVLDIYSGDERKKSVIVDTKTNEILDELPVNHLAACHQMDFIRLQNELDSIDKTVKKMGRNMFKNLWKPVRYFIPVVIIILLMVLGSCSNNLKDHNVPVWEITGIELQDSVIHQNILDKTLGIPSQIRTVYRYRVTLSEINRSVPDTVIILPAGGHINPDDFIGTHLQFYEGGIYGTE